MCFLHINPLRAKLFWQKWYQHGLLIDLMVKWLGQRGILCGCLRPHPCHLRHRPTQCHWEWLLLSYSLKEEDPGATSPSLSPESSMNENEHAASTSRTYAAISLLTLRQVYLSATQTNFKFKLLKLPTTVLPVHQCETKLVSTAIPELNIGTIHSVKMMTTMPSHPAPPVVSSGKTCLTSVTR